MSTTEAEIVALSMSMRELLWLRRLTVDVASTLGCEINKVTQIKSKIARVYFHDQVHPHKALVFQGISNKSVFITRS